MKQIGVYLALFVCCMVLGPATPNANVKSQKIGQGNQVVSSDLQSNIPVDAPQKKAQKEPSAEATAGQLVELPASNGPPKKAKDPMDKLDLGADAHAFQQLPGSARGNQKAEKSMPDQSLEDLMNNTKLRNRFSF